MKSLALTLLFGAAIAPAAHADIFDRINQCRNQGGGTCVFDILTELASKNGSGNLCTCTTEYDSNYREFDWKAYKGGKVVVRSGHGSGYRWDTKDKALQACQEAIIKSPNCYN